MGIYRHALNVTPQNFMAHSNYGKAFQDQGKQDEAKAEFRKSLAIEPRDFQAHNSLGVIERRRGNVNVAIANFLAALDEKRDFAVVATSPLPTMI